MAPIVLLQAHQVECGGAAAERRPRATRAVQHSRAEARCGMPDDLIKIAVLRMATAATANPMTR